jgi:MFS family permease
LLAAAAPEWSWFYVVFALRGAYLAGSLLSGIAIALEFSAPDMRPTYIGLNSTFSGVAAVLAPLVGSLLADLLGFQALFFIGSAVGACGLVMLRWLVREPRFHQAAP